MTSTQSSRLGKVPEEGVKAPVVVSTISNISLSGLPIISSVQLVAGDRVLVKNQSNNKQNGIYCAAVGNWDRATDWNKDNDVVNGQLVVDSNSGQLYRTSFTGDFSINNTSINFYTVQSFNSKDDTTLATALLDATYLIGDVVHVKSIDGGVNETTMIFDVVASVTEDIPNGIYSGVNHSFVMRSRDNLNSATINEAAARKDYKIGSILNIKDITSGDLVGSIADIVLASTVRVNGRNIFSCTGVTELAIKLRALTEVYQSFDWYVDPINGTDEFGQGVTAGEGAFKTIQFAWDSLPTKLSPTFQQGIICANGVYAVSSIPEVSQPRPAVLWGKDKITTGRSTLSSGVISGAIVIKGNPLDRTAVKIITSTEYPYGVYINKGNIGMQDLSIESNGINKASALLVAHRTDTYIQCFNVVLDGKDELGSKFASSGCVTESTGQIELADKCLVTNCDNGIQELTDGDNVVVSGSSQVINCLAGATVTSGNLKLSMTDGSLTSSNMIDNCVVGLRCFSGQIDVRGLDSTHRAVINSPIECESSTLNFVFSDTEDTVTAHNCSSLKYDSSNFQRQISLRASTVWLRNANSYTALGSPNNTDNIPIAFLYESTAEYEGVNNIVGAAGGPASFNPRTLTYTANSQVQATSLDTDKYTVSGSGANRLTCQIDSTGVTDGRTIFIDGSTWGVEFTSGIHMDVPVDFSVGNGTGQYSGAILTMRDGLWRVNALGQLRV